MKSKVLGAAALVAAAAWSAGAYASTTSLDFAGSGVGGVLTLTYSPDTNTGALPSSLPVGPSGSNPVDPINSDMITGVTGYFSDSGLGLNNVTVTGIVALNRVAPEPGNTYAPNSFSLLPVASGVPAGPGEVSLGLHYDNLLYPMGSPQTAASYAGSGGELDIYGLAFQLSNGESVNLWSNGGGQTGPIYGVAVTDGATVLTNVGGVSVSAAPEPATWALMTVGVGLAGVALRRRRKGATLAVQAI